MKINRERLTRKMNGMGFRETTLGTPMLRDAVEMWRPGMMATKELYPALATKYRTTPAGVERCIRFAIAAAAQRGNGDAWNECFGYSVYAAVDVPTNKEFIARMYWLCADED